MLASDGATFVTGQTLVVDGGFSLIKGPAWGSVREHRVPLHPLQQRPTTPTATTSAALRAPTEGVAVNLEVEYAEPLRIVRRGAAARGVWRYDGGAAAYAPTAP